MDVPHLRPPKRSKRGRVAPFLRSRKFFGQLVFVILVVLSAGAGVLGGLVFVYSSELPQVRQLESYRPDVMTVVYADNGAPIARFALQHRVMVTYNQIPPMFRNAVISVEDRGFESDWGIDILGIVRAAIVDILEWRKAQGASTLTQQLARMLFLTPRKTFRRKFQEALLAIQIERRFTKPQIFTMYTNQVPMGFGNYGFATAAQFYYGKRLDQLTLPEAALLAGLPQAPTYFSPILHPRQSIERRNVVLKAMLENGKITRSQYRTALKAPLDLHVQRWNNNIAPYFVEDIRQFLEHKYGLKTIQEKGLRVYTTLNVKMQREAQKALRHGLRVYSRSRGWRGPEQNILKTPVKLQDGKVATLKTYNRYSWNNIKAGQLVHGIVMKVNPLYATVRFGDITAKVKPADFAWTRRRDPRRVFTPGDIDLFRIDSIKGSTAQVMLDQTPLVNGALVAVNNATGEIKAMVGGYSYARSQFNRATQAFRQVGSSFKPYVYAQALLDGLGPFDTIVDGPVSFRTSSGLWAPHDYDQQYEGSITLLRALAESRNIPAVKILAKVGIENVIKLCRRFGVTTPLDPDLPMALGASSLTLLEHASAYSTFPDDGVHITPREILKITDYNGRVIAQFPPHVTDVLPAGIARIETSMLRQVFVTGTGVRDRALAEKYPIAGKTGTTNNFTDAWFLGYSPSVTCGVYVGFDDHHTLGPGEEGSHVALPIWTQFMEAVLKNKPIQHFPDSPLLTKPKQVQKILASAGTSSLLASDSTADTLGARLSETKPVSSIQLTRPTQQPAPVSTADTTPNPAPTQAQAN